MPVVESRLPREMASRLASVRHRIRAVELALAGERAVLALIAAVVISFVLDTALEPDLGVRRPFTIFLLASALLAGGGFFALAFKRRLTDDTVAVLIEQVYPELEDGLVSSVQLSRDLERGGLGHTSPALIRSVIARTSTKARNLDFGRVVDPSPLLPATFLTLAALFGVAVFSFQQTTGPLARAWFERCVLGREVMYPKAIDLKITVPNEVDGVTAVARGDDIPVEIAVLRGRSKVEKLIVRTWALKKDESGNRYQVRGKPEETRLQQVGPETESKYRKIYQNVTEAFEFEVYAGNNIRSGRHRVVVVDRPRVEEARFWLTYPEYVGIPPTPAERPETQPDLRVPMGTEIRYEVIGNKALATAHLLFEAAEPAAAKPSSNQPSPPEVKPVQGPEPVIGGREKLDRRVLTGKFPVTKTTKFRFDLTSLDGYSEGPKPVVFSVTAVVDKPPEVRIPVPGRPKQVTPRAIVPLEVEIKEDYGIVKAELRLKVEPAANAAAGAEKQDKTELLQLPAEATKTASIKHRLDLSIEYALHPGDRVTYKAVAWDNDVLLPEDKRMGESTAFQLQVVAPEDLARVLQDRLQRVKEDLIVTGKLQKDAREHTDKLVQSLAAKTKLDENDRKDLLHSDYDQRKVTSRLVAIALEMDRLVEERELNRLGDETALEREKDIRDGTKELAEKLSPLVSQEFELVRAAPELEPKVKARLALVPDAQEKVEKAIVKLAELIDKFADFSDVIRDVRELLGIHDRAIQQTEDAIKKSNNKK
ncbi:MAG: DUF4175 family protein [Planctomycetota bacterium]